MRPLFFRLATILVAALAAAGAVAPAAAAPQLVRTLPNKATLIVRENRTRPVVSVQVWVLAGTRDESRPERGAASVLAQLPWEGNAARPKEEISNTLAMVGGSYTGEVATGHILYQVDAPARSLGRAVNVLADALLRPSFEEKAVENAKSAARSTSRVATGHAVLASVNPMLDALHPGSPLGAPRAVSENEIAALTIPLVSRFYQTWFTGSNVMIVVVGDVDPEETAQVVGKAFAGLSAKGGARHARADKERRLAGPAVIAANNPEGSGGACVTIGFRAPTWGSADALALDALVAMLTDHGEARLQKRLGEGPFFGVSSQRSFEADGGSIAISIAVPPENLADAEGILFGELARARFTPVTDEEFRRAVETVIARDFVAQADLSGEARVTALAAMQGTTGGDEVYAERLRALKPEDLAAVGREYLDLNQSVVVGMVPKNIADSLRTFDGFEARVKENLRLAAAPYQSGGPLPSTSASNERRRRVDAPLARIPAAPRDAGRGLVTRATLDSGIRVVASESHGPAVATVAVYLEGGVRYENEKDNGITKFLRDVFLTSADPAADGRAYRFSLVDLGRLVPYQDRDSWGFSLTVPSERWKEAATRLGAMLAHPELDSVTVDATRLLMLDDQIQWSNNDLARRRQLIFTTKYRESGYRLPQVGSRASIVRTGLPELQEFYRRFVVKPNLVVAVFGDVNAAEVAPAVAQAFRDVSSAPFSPGALPKEPPNEGFREKWEMGEGPSCTVSVAFNGPPLSSPDLPAVYVINSLFTNPRGWFQQYVREKGAGILDVQSYVAQGVEESPIVATVNVESATQEEAAVKLLFGQFRSAAAIRLTGGTYAADYENARQHAVSTFQMGLASNAGRAFQWARAELFRLPAGYVDTFPTKLMTVSPEDIQVTAFQYFQYVDAGKRPYAVCETRPGGW